jgi:DNA-directed RNA polymerase specialized sigma subunit
MNELNLIRQRAWSFHKSTGIDWEELFSEACLAYSEALFNYDSKRGRITTYVYHCINSHLINYIRELQRKHIEMISLEEINLDIPMNFYHLIDQLSREAAEIVQLILNEPCKYSLMNSDEAKKEVAAEMLKINGYTMKHVWSGIRDLKLEFSLK